MIRTIGQRGEGQAGCIAGLLVLLAVGFFSYKVIPPKLKAAEMRQYIIDEGKSAGLRKGDADIRKRIMSKAEELEIPLDPKDLDIARFRGKIRITAEYTIPVEFPGYTHEWHFSHRTENPLF